jgi:hypothetical protein
MDQFSNRALDQTLIALLLAVGNHAFDILPEVT